MFCFLAKDLTSLHAHAKRLVRAGVRPSTARTDNSAQKRYMDFCSQYGLLALPADENTLLLYIAYLNSCGLCAGTVRVYLAGIRSLHIEEGLGNPLEDKYRLSRALRALTITSEAPKRRHAE